MDRKAADEDGYGTRLIVARRAARDAPEWHAARRLLLDVDEDIWRVAARAVAGLVFADPQGLASQWLGASLGDTRWRDRAMAVVVELASRDPQHALSTSEGPLPAQQLLLEFVLGQRGAASCAAALAALEPAALGPRAERALHDWAETGDARLQRLALEALGRCATPRSYARARMRFEALLSQRVYTLPDHVERGRAIRAAARWLIESVRSGDDRNLTRRVAGELHRRYARGDQLMRGALLCELFRWTSLEERLGIPRGVFDAAGESDAHGGRGPSALVELLEALRGAALARAYWRALGARASEEGAIDFDRVAALLARRDFLIPRHAPAPGQQSAKADGDVSVEDCLAFFDRLVRAEERAFFLCDDFFSDASEYRALDPEQKATLLLALDDCYRRRFPLTPAQTVSELDLCWPGRFAALAVRLIACNADAQGSMLARVACLARDTGFPRLFEAGLAMLLVNRDRQGAIALDGSLAIVEPLLHSASELQPGPRRYLVRIVEVVLDRASRGSEGGDRLLRLVLMLLDAGVRPALLEEVGRCARAPRVADLLNAVAGLQQALDLEAESPERLCARMEDFAYRLPSLLAGESNTRDGLASRLRLVRTLLASPLLGGIEAGVGEHWERALVVLARARGRAPSSRGQPRVVGNLLRDLADEVETYSTIDFGAVRERRAALTRVEERVDALPRAFSDLPPLERMGIARVTARWKVEIDRAERFLLKQRTSLFAGEPAEALGLEPGAAAEGPAGAVVAEVREALHRFRIRFLVRLYDLDRAFALLRHGPDVSEQQILGDRLHGRALACVMLLLFGPYLGYPLLPVGLAGALHCAAAGIGLLGGGLLLLIVGRRDPWSLLPLLLPRLMGAILTWYFVLTLGEELWTFTAAVDEVRFLLLVLPTASCCLLYTLTEVTRHGDSRARAWYKAVVAYAVGLTQSFAIGAFLTGVLGPAILAERLGELGSRRVLGVPVYIEPFGLPFFPSIVLMWSFLVLFLAMFLNLLFEDKAMIEV